MNSKNILLYFLPPLHSHMLVHSNETIFLEDKECFYETILKISILSPSKKFRTFIKNFRFRASVQRWIRVASMGTKRLGVAVAVLDGYLYAIGGSDGQCPLSTVNEKYMFI
jgi:hypothetical protein